jgi:peptide deformylase
MKRLRIRLLGDPVLRKKARRVDKITPKIRETIEGMWDTMYHAKGIGLAANQVGLLQRIIIVDTREEGEKIALVNPEVLCANSELTPLNEGCLSIPGVEGEVLRPSRVTVSGLTPDGKRIELEVGGLFAKVFQHEIDHLNGVLFIDRITSEELERLKPELEKFETCTPV